MSLPKSLKALESDFNDCIRVKAFVKVPKETFSEYLERSRKDFASAKNDLNNGYPYWALVKAYQALFFVVNALLVKYCGYFSKDHKCLLTALLKEKIISSELVKRLKSKLKDLSKLNKIDELRLERNLALYKPDSWKTITKNHAEKLLEETRALILEFIALF